MLVVVTVSLLRYKNQSGRGGQGIKRYKLPVLAGVTQWIECQPEKQRDAGWISSQGTCLGCGLGPQLGMCERQPHTDDSLPLILPSFPPLKINK